MGAITENKANFRRRYPRRPMKRKVGILCDGSYFVADSGEIGEGGMSIVTDFVLTEGHQLVVSLQIPHGDFVFLRAVVKSTEKKMGDHLVTHGLSFENVGFSIKRQIRVFVSARKEIQLSSG